MAGREHDKDPTTFFNVLYRLQNEGYKFTVSVLGECFTQIPDVFLEARDKLSSRIVNWGFQTRDDYCCTLSNADVSVSTALHEFFGVAISDHVAATDFLYICDNDVLHVECIIQLESVSLGCFPLCPAQLVYPEIFPDECLYRTTNQLYKKLRTFCVRPHLSRRVKPVVSLDRFSWKQLRQKYEELLKAPSLYSH